MPHADEALLAVAQRCLPRADSDTQAIVAAVAGLLGCVAYADRELSTVERQRAEKQLSTVEGLEAKGAAMLVNGIADHLHELSNVHRNRFTRTLRDLGSRELRVHVLGMLVELAATDEELVQSEVNWLRQTATALGLTQDDYNDLQKQYRQHLGTLKS